MKHPKPTREGAYIIRSIDGYCRPPADLTPPPGYVPAVPTVEDRALARAVLAYHAALDNLQPPKDGT
jgi:hypothetical protein